MFKLNSTTQKILFHQAELKKLEDGTYLQDDKNDNFQYIRWKFFANDTEDKAKLLNVGSWIFETVASIIPAYVGNIDIDIGMNITELTEDIVTLWFGVYSIERVNAEYQLINQPGQNYIYEDWLDKIIRFYENDKLSFALVQTFGIGYIENKLYQVKSFKQIEWSEIALNSIPQTAWLEPRIDTWLSVPAIFLVYDNTPSTIEKIISLTYGVDRHTVMLHTQFLQHTESFVLLKNINLPTKLQKSYSTWTEINFSEIGRIVNWIDETSSIEFVNNVNSQIEACSKETENFIRRISAMTGIPIEFFGLDSNDWAIGEWSRTLKQGTFIKKIQAIRDLIDESLKTSLEVVKIKEQYKRPDIFAKSSEELATELATAREAKLISWINAIKTYNNFTEEEAQAEYDLIINEPTWSPEWEKSTSPNWKTESPTA